MSKAFNWTWLSVVALGLGTGCKSTMSQNSLSSMATYSSANLSSVLSSSSFGMSSVAQSSSSSVALSSSGISSSALSSATQSSAQMSSSSQIAPSKESASCGKGGTSNGQINKFTYTDSWGWLGVPVNQSKPLPLVVALHGDEGHPDNMKYFWQNVWQTNQDFIFFAPKCPASICGESVGAANSWSRGGVAGSAAQRDWLIGAIKDIASKYNVDVSRIYAVGYSGGSLFLGYQAFRMQNLWAGVQLACGGVNESESEVYQIPPKPECKVPGRLVISMNGGVNSQTLGDKYYLKSAALNVQSILQKNGHRNDFYDTQCDGHCCGDAVNAVDQYAWFKTLPPKCGVTLGQGCWQVSDIPK